MPSRCPGAACERRPSSPTAPARSWTKPRSCRLANSRSSDTTTSPTGSAASSPDSSTCSRSDLWSLSVNAGVGNDDYDDSYFGLQESSFRVAGVAFDVQRPNGLGAGASYNYERYAGLQRSRSASAGAEFEDPNRDWTTDSTENVHYFSLYLTPPRMGRNTEARFVYDYSNARANYVYGIVPGSPLVPPNQLPEAYNTLQELRAELRHRLSRQLAASVSYTFENVQASTTSRWIPA